MSPTWRSFAVVPAAGRSERMGQPKLLLPWRGQTVMHHILSAWQSGGVTQIVTVIRPGDPDLEQIARAAGVDVVVPPTAPPQMKDSIGLALRHIAERYLPSAADAWLLAPADMPWLSPAMIRTLLATHNPHSPQILVPVHDEKRGHPVLFPWSLASEVATLAPGEGVNSIKQRHGWSAVNIAEDFVLGDLDTPEDYVVARSLRDR